MRTGNAILLLALVSILSTAGCTSKEEKDTKKAETAPTLFSLLPRRKNRNRFY